ncbi:hypothetical protein KEM60_01435 [Austwickia sp. TVS 96-490-7B]|uniref:protein-arginine deiminase family protein n=1 Tax=Austwickia sp. TVS 96-490-7B TaxID=2830843 RepID=UPI001C57ACC6|nr:protein-arginine deiminase family protein [Austwickia sp. TVS 96-490-7B]MBW3085238.1 hypothetical protein [Austwickia sp. TVS 96-490-7B]
MFSGVQARSRRTVALIVALGVVGPIPGLVGTANAAEKDQKWVVLRADANRDGVVDIDGDGDKEPGQNSAGRGAVFLANVDDDSGRCKVKDGKKFLPMSTLAGCHDGTDEIVNGPEDEKDLAPLRTGVPGTLPVDAVGQLKIEGAAAKRTRLFMKRDKEWVKVRPDMKISATDLRAGLRLGLEGTDILRDTSVWDGQAKVTLTVTSKGKSQSESVTLRQAPLKLQHDLQKVEQVSVSSAGGKDTMVAFLKEFRNALKPSGAKITELDTLGDEWVQDLFEPMYQQMPAAKGATQMMRVAVSADMERDGSPSVYQLRGKDVGVVRIGSKKVQDSINAMGNLENLPPYSHGGKNFPEGRPLIGARQSKIVLDKKPGDKPKPTGSVKPSPTGTAKPSPTGSTKPTSSAKPTPTGKDATTAPAAVEKSDKGGDAAKADPKGKADLKGKADPKDKGGKSAPKEEQGDKMSKDTLSFIKAQNLAEPLVIDTGFMGVGHVDEIVNVIPAKNERGWKIAVADPQAGVNLLKKAMADGHGNVPFFFDETEPGRAKLKDYAEDAEILSINAQAAKAMEKNIKTLKDNLGLSDAEIVKVPVFLRGLFGHIEDQDEDAGFRGATAFISNAVNSLAMGDGSLITPLQVGPVVGKDKKNIFADAVKEAYTKAGVKMVVVRDKDVYQMGGGNIHCGTNVFRAVSQAQPKK